MACLVCAGDVEFLSHWGGKKKASIICHRQFVAWLSVVPAFMLLPRTLGPAGSSVRNLYTYSSPHGKLCVHVYEPELLHLPGSPG